MLKFASSSQATYAVCNSLALDLCFSIAFLTFNSAEEAAEVVKNGPVEINGQSYNVEMARDKRDAGHGGGRGGGRGGRGGK